MSYEVLARKWRPANFEELVGQEHVQRALVNALDEDRLHHAYLFTGTRGVGKTTIARIFARALNCETGVTSKPCGECASCQEISEGRFIDLIEVDAASRTGVDDTRELLENVQYAPARGRYKVYLIDEVHMFSKSSFNALLKTLEEPPPHVKFLLATTDPQKLPVTVLSRCLQFNLKRLPVNLIISQLQKILVSDAASGEANTEASHELAAVQLLAEGADGSMRDALSLLDQALAFGSGVIRETDVREMLGTVSRDKVLDIIRALIDRNSSKTLSALATLAELAPDYDNMLTEILSLLHHMALAKKVPEALDDFVSEREVLFELCEKVSSEDLHLFYQIALIGRRDLSLAPNARSGLEMILLRMLSFRPVAVKAINTGEIQTGAVKAGSSSSENTKTSIKAPKPDLSSASKKSPVKDVNEKQRMPTKNIDGSDWRKILQSLSINGMVRQLAANCMLQKINDNSVSLLLDAGFKQLRNVKAEKRLQQALSEYFNADIRLEINIDPNSKNASDVANANKTETPAQSLTRESSERQQQAETAIEEDGFVQAMKKNFNAEVVPGSVKPVTGKNVTDQHIKENDQVATKLEDEVSQ
jgi:DNA polymerase-3 subunit gamma/tau